MISTADLDLSSPRLHPNDLIRSDGSDGYRLKRRQLWVHQETALSALHTLETKDIPVSFDEAFDTSTVRLQFGVFGDRPGSGKTMTMLLLAMCTRLDECRPNERHFMSDLACITIVPKNDVLFIPKTLFVVPHQLVRQWESEAKDIGLSSKHVSTFLGFETSKDDEEDKDDDQNDENENEEGSPPKKPRTEARANMDKIHRLLHDKTRVVIMSCRAYTQMTNILDIKNVRFERLVFDEADSSRLPNATIVPANFTWLMTATFDCFRPREHTFIGHVQKSNVQLFNTLFKEPRMTIAGKHSADNILMHNAILAKSIVFNCPKFVMESLKLPLVNYRSVPDDPILSQLLQLTDLDQVATRRAIKMRMAGTAGLESVTCLETLHVIPPDMCALSLKVFDQAVRDAKYAELPCCSKRVHVDILVHMMTPFGPYETHRCPCCRAECNGLQEILSRGSDNAFKQKNVKKIFNDRSICEYVVHLISSRPKSSVIIFQDGDSTPLIKRLSARGISSETLYKSTGAAIAKRIRAFQSGQVRALLMSSATQAAGLNLQHKTTHVICMHPMEASQWYQLVNRGNRFPRRRSLVVYHMQRSNFLDHACESDADTEYDDESDS